MLEVRQLGGALSGPATALSPMAHTTAGFSLNAIGMTPTPERAAAVAAHLARIEQRIGALATGDTYVNFLDLEGATEKRVRAAYSTADWQRLVRLKDQYDLNTSSASTAMSRDRRPPSPRTSTDRTTERRPKR